MSLIEGNKTLHTENPASSSFSFSHNHNTGSDGHLVLLVAVPAGDDAVKELTQETEDKVDEGVKKQMNALQLILKGIRKDIDKDIETKKK